VEVKMLRREVYTSGRVRERQFAARKQEYVDKDIRQLVARDRFITENVNQEERVENKRYGCEWDRI
jgi:hypothetical protein